jgi:hypothetical protein
MVFPAGTGSEFVISTPASVALFRPAQRLVDSDCACAAVEHATSTTIPIFEYLIAIASQQVRTPLIAKVRGTLDYTDSPAPPAIQNKSLYSLSCNVPELDDANGAQTVGSRIFPVKFDQDGMRK